ncbi:MAG: TOPRIM nucleotidyl transferase/hydrolase domain-containing protein, partial [Colwellia sp.]
NFPLGNIDEMLRLLQLQFNPDESGNSIDTSRLSDGQKSLVYFALTKALFDIDKVTRTAVSLGEETNFDPDKMKLPIFSLIALEEPENHLSPHYLGRIVNLIKEYGQSELCQSIVSTHSSSIVGRIEPKQIRHFRLDCQHKSTSISSLTLPKDADEQAKFISEAVKAYPEIYFAKMVILGEGDSEQVILPKILEHFSTDLDSHSISVVPLGGRHVNHFWRLLDSLKIPYITLLDFDIDRNGGGFGRIKYAIEQLSNYKSVNYLHKEMLHCIPKWDDPRSPVDFTVSFKNKDETTSVINLKDELENNNVFFSNPLDIDYSMIECFPEVFCTPDKTYGERGPIEGKEDEEEVSANKREVALLKAVLKKGNSGVRFKFTGDYLNNFLWYRYRFLSNKSKPASHVRMFSKLEENYPSVEIVRKLPPELIRLATKVSAIIEEVVE